MPPPFHVMVETAYGNKRYPKKQRAISKYEIMWPSVPNTDFKFNITQEM